MEPSSVFMGLVDCSQPQWWVLTALLSGAMTHFALRPVFSWLRTRALAHPNSRSSHTVPTPQGAGIVIIPVAIMVAALPFALQVCTPTHPAAAVHACLSVGGHPVSYTRWVSR